MTFQSTIHRAAVLVKSLNKEQAGKLLALLDPSELKQLSQTIACLGEIDKKQERLAIRKFVELASRRQFQTRRGKTQPEVEKPFEFLVKTDATVRHELLAEEHPRIVAIILALLPIQTASATLNSFVPVQRVSILRRLCRSDKVENEELMRLSIGMKKRLQAKLVAACFINDGVDTASRLLSCTDIATRENLFDSLASDEATLSDDLKSRMVAFDHLLQLKDADVKVLLAHSDTSLWAPALVHSGSEIRNRIFDNLAAKPTTLLKQEIAQTANVDFVVGSAAQAAIVSTMLELHDANRIAFASGRKNAASNQKRAASNQKRAA